MCYFSVLFIFFEQCILALIGSSVFGQIDSCLVPGYVALTYKVALLSHGVPQGSGSVPGPILFTFYVLLLDSKSSSKT